MYSDKNKFHKTLYTQPIKICKTYNYDKQEKIFMKFKRTIQNIIGIKHVKKILNQFNQ